jgi:predicted nucleic acid-binding protein
MKNMVSKILLDTNILLDYLLTREPFYEDSRNIMLLCKQGKIKACIAAHTISNMFFILRKDYTPKERREILINICSIFDVESIDKTKLLAGLENENISDFEDGLQIECAKAYGADYIVTRNMEDYFKSEIPAISPNDFCKLLEES